MRWRRMGGRIRLLWCCRRLGLLLFGLISLFFSLRGFWVGFLLASAGCLWSAWVAPVRGGTYFSLPPQRKVGKRKRLEAPAKWAPWSAQGSGATGIRALPRST